MIAWRALLLGILIGVLATGVVAAWRGLRPSSPATPAPPAPELRAEIATRVECKPIVVYRDKIKQELGLPADVQANPARQVVAATKVPADDHARTVSAVADLESGQIDLFIRQDPRPWLALERRPSIGLVYGVDEDGRTLLRGIGQVDLLQSRRLHLGAVLHVDTGGHVLAGATVTFR